jgi:hypothetical protein
MISTDKTLRRGGFSRQNRLTLQFKRPTNFYMQSCQRTLPKLLACQSHVQDVLGFALLDLPAKPAVWWGIDGN